MADEICDCHVAAMLACAEALHIKWDLTKFSKFSIDYKANGE